VAVAMTRVSFKQTFPGVKLCWSVSLSGQSLPCSRRRVSARKGTSWPCGPPSRRDHSGTGGLQRCVGRADHSTRNRGLEFRYSRQEAWSAMRHLGYSVNCHIRPCYANREAPDVKSLPPPFALRASVPTTAERNADPPTC